MIHLVGVHDNNVISLYINGSLADAADISGHTGLAGQNGQPTTGSGFRQDLSDIYSWAGDLEKPLMIGGARCQQGDSTCYVSVHGSIGESAFYRRALTAGEIQEHFGVGTGTPPADPDPSYDPYRALVLSDSASGYWRHRESELHGMPSIDGQQVVDASGSGWHGAYRTLVPTQVLHVVIALAGDSVGPVLANCFDAVAQIARHPCSATDPAAREDTLSVTVRAEYQPSGAPAAGAGLRLYARSADGSGGHGSNHGDRPTGTFFLPGQDTNNPSAGQRGEILLTLSDSGKSETLIYRTSGISGIEILTAEVSHEETQTILLDSITVRYPGLLAVDRQGTDHFFKDQDPTVAGQRHGNTNHHASAGNKTAVLDLFRAYREEFADTLKFEVTEMSLLWGGLLDIDATPWSDPHQTHRQGLNTDLGLDNLPKNRHQRFRKMCTDRSLTCTLEGDHFHVFYYGG